MACAELTSRWRSAVGYDGRTGGGLLQTLTERDDQQKVQRRKKTKDQQVRGIDVTVGHGRAGQARAVVSEKDKQDFSKRDKAGHTGKDTAQDQAGFATGRMALPAIPVVPRAEAEAEAERGGGRGGMPVACSATDQRYMNVMHTRCGLPGSRNARPGGSNGNMQTAAVTQAAYELAPSARSLKCESLLLQLRHDRKKRQRVKDILRAQDELKDVRKSYNDKKM
ncbi:uncharacterized protein MONBRDRAFT_7277 [Monosiga brevicollis MX1]|uniref:Uncharacterized protein n=1 Tax=Monosiga brevicollis TaxID=81824 RepID=A9UWG9_MONBE|nr:uncharacterized protein MONBRDRAFT_7277 [Monosiga brevicollis MX1]EDQ90210.1 predicted protein [Monosiga brevicollis MX1]|eukprot:XP_001744977.1 hypothetical protein [Monosiga brevicollis MX1]